MIQKDTSEMLINHFLNIPVIRLFSKDFPFHSFAFQETIEDETYQIPNTILGKQAEAIFEHLLRISKRYTLLSANTQIQGVTETIGELDYILRDIVTNESIHIEVACKFYLFDDSIENKLEGKWIGSNRKDTLLDKLNKLKTKQFPLLQRPEVHKTLTKLDLQVSDINQQHYILTSLYIPQAIDIETFPEEYQKCIVGTWILFKELKLKGTCDYAIPDKKEWLLPALTVDTWMCAKVATTKISESIAQRRAVQVYEKHNNIVKKFFVVWW